MAGVESSEGRKGHEEKAIRMTLEFPYARQLGKGRAFFFFLIWREFCFIMGFPSATVLKNLPEVKETWVHMGSIPESGRSPGEGNGYLLRYSLQERPMDRGAWCALVHGIARDGHDLNTKPSPPPLLL